MNLSIFKRVFCGIAAIFLFIAGLPVLAAAGAKVKIDDTKFFQIGMGYRGSLTVEEDAATNGTDSSFNPATENFRLYTVSQAHKNIQVEFNTEIATASDTSGTADVHRKGVIVLDAVARTGSPAINKNIAAKPQKTRLKIDKFIKKILLALKND